MIFDRFAHRDVYVWPDALKRALDFIASLDADADEAKYPLKGEDMYAIVTSYESKSPEEAVFEAHQKYIDVQAVISGAEVIEWSPIEGLPLRTPYDESRDVAFFERLRPGIGRAEMHPGSFMILYPQDAHAPGLRLDDTARMVKKVVVKVGVKLLKP